MKLGRSKKIQNEVIALQIILLMSLVIILIIVFRPKTDNKINYYYQIINSNENSHLIHINDDINYKLIINSSNYGKQN